jgi:hypothetical protein
MFFELMQGTATFPRNAPLSLQNKRFAAQLPSSTSPNSAKPRLLNFI